MARTLYHQMQGDDVRMLQQMLIAQGYGKLLGASLADGIFGPKTLAAVKAFQHDHQLETDGVVGKNTLSALTPKKPEKQEPNKEAHAAITVAAQHVFPPLAFAHPLGFDAVSLDWGKLSQQLTAPTLPQQILAAAQGEVGKGESKGDNRGAAVQQYKSVTHHKTEGQAWCADFTSYILQTEAPGVVKPHSLAKNLMQQFKTQDAFHKASSDYTPKPGDLIFFDRGRESWKGHIGFVEKVDADGTLHTIEGNRSNPDAQPGQWNAADPDKVRRISYSPEDLKQLKKTQGLKLRGYGSMEEMVDAKLGDLPTPTTPLVFSKHALASR